MVLFINPANRGPGVHTGPALGHLSVANGFVSSKIYDKHDDFDFDIVNFPFLDGDVPRRASYGVYQPGLPVTANSEVRGTRR